jgi:hypothetical protein
VLIIYAEYLVKNVNARTLKIKEIGSGNFAAFAIKSCQPVLIDRQALT